jgi:hypothetical protein
MESMSDLVGGMSESHWLYTNGREFDWTMLLLKLYWINWQTESHSILLVSAKKIWNLRNREILSDVLFQYDAIRDLNP